MSWMVFHGRLLVTLIIIMYLCTRINEHNERKDMDKQTVTKVNQSPPIHRIQNLMQ
jgi:hypothetical protein